MRVMSVYSVKLRFSVFIRDRINIYVFISRVGIFFDKAILPEDPVRDVLGLDHSDPAGLKGLSNLAKWSKQPVHFLFEAFLPGRIVH